MSTSAHPSLHKSHGRSRWPLWLTCVVLLVGVAVLVDRVALAPSKRAPQITFIERPDLAWQVASLVTGSARTAPGATAYVLGSKGAWLGAEGLANVSTGETMPPDARMRLESVSKLFTATLILQLDQQGKLHVTDTVQRWLPGLLPFYGSKITIRELLTMSSGLISDSDIEGSRAKILRQLARVKDLKLRAQLIAVGKQSAANPAVYINPIWPIRWAAWQPLLFKPGTGYHYSNIGYNILGLIAERATGKPLAALYQQRIFTPLGFKHTAYDPQGPIQGPHAHGYLIAPNGKITDTTAWAHAKGADGGIVSDAQDTATFLIGLMRGKLIDQQELAGMKGENLWRGGDSSPCGGRAYGWAGEGEGFKTAVWVNGNGTRVAVLLTNAHHPPYGGQIVEEMRVNLYCDAG